METSNNAKTVLRFFAIGMAWLALCFWLLFFGYGAINGFHNYDLWAWAVIISAIWLTAIALPVAFYWLMFGSYRLLSALLR